jgi:hypothetical protein
VVPVVLLKLQNSLLEFVTLLDMNRFRLFKFRWDIILESQWAEPVSLTFHSILRKLYTEPSIGASYQMLVHLAAQFQRRLFRNRPTRNKNYLWWPYLLTNRDELSNLYRGPSHDASNQASFHLGKWIQRRRFFRHLLIRNKNCFCLLTDQN